MTDALSLAEQSVTLGSLIAPLQAAGYPAELIEAGEELDLPTLVVRLDDDGSGRQRLLTINVMPLDLGGEVGVSLAQVYAPLPFRLAEEHRDEFGRFALTANGLMPTASIGARGDGEIYLRHMVATPAGHVPDGAMVAGLVSLIEYQSDVFGDAMETVATGEASAEQALAAFGGG